MDTEAALRALQDVDFDWTTHVDNIWRDLPFDVPEVQNKARRQLADRVERLAKSTKTASPLGVPIVGTAGAGKTHLLSAVRKDALERGAFFVLADMTDVTEFWETMLLGFIRSLQERGADGHRQHERLLEGLVRTTGSDGVVDVDRLKKGRPPGLINQTDALIRALAREHAAPTREHQDVLRALVLFTSDDFELQDLGYKWLQAMGLEETERVKHGFREVRRQPMAVVRGLSWLMSLVAPTVVALDQLDAIVAEHNLLSVRDGEELTSRQQTSLGIIQGLAGGLMAMRDVTQRTLIVVSSLEATWRILDSKVTVSMRDRYEPEILLHAVSDAAQLSRLVEQRLAAAYGASGFRPPYPTYPFSPAFFVEHKGVSPREMMKRCDEHRRHCLRKGVVEEIGAEVDKNGDDVTVDFRPQLEEQRRAATVESWLAKEDDDALDKLLEAACDALAAENSVKDSVDVHIDRDFAGTKGYAPLHARIRLIFRDEGDRELHYALRFLQKNHAVAFQARLKAAMTASGIDHSLNFRRLVVMRCGAIPSGPATEKLMAEFTRRGGAVIEPSIDELRTLHAVATLLAGPNNVQVRDWLARERIVSRLPSFVDATKWLFGSSRVSNHPPVSVDAPGGAPPPSVDDTRGRSTGDAAPAAGSDRLFIGHRVVGGSRKDVLDVPLDNLTKHTVVLAGAGSGKTVLVRRLVEEAALLDVPSIVVDGANDLSRLGDAWPTPPENFDEHDRKKAAQYFSKAEVVVWTPGRESGNPLNLALLPDFAAVGSDPDELTAAIDMARSSLEPIVAPGRGQKGQVMRGVLAAALRYFAKTGGRTLGELIELLMDLPADEQPGFEKGAKQARTAAELILAEVETNPLLRGSGAELDPGQLLRSSTPGKVRVSVINLSGLPSLLAQQHFVNQLAMTLFSWIKKHPARGRSLQGLLVIDEARDFVPSTSSVPSKDNLIRLAAQARKYGLGIVFATQAPKSIDHNVIANASTHFYGRANSPTAVEVVQEQLRNRGGSGADIAKLPRGTFYVFSEGLSAPVKVATSLCLSHHPPSPPDDREILDRAVASRALVSRA